MWPDINPGCERVQLFYTNQKVPYPYTRLREFRGHWDEPNKNLRHWIINKACAKGADAVINVVETQGYDEDGPVWNIRGDAVVYQR